MNFTVRLGALLSLTSFAVCANALTLHFQTEGQFISSASNISGNGTTVTLVDPTVTTANFTKLSYSFTKGAGTPFIPGSYTLNGGIGKLELVNGSIDFTFGTGLGSPTSAPANKQYTANQAGIITFSNGTGIFSGLNGSGTMSFNTSANNNASTGDVTTNFDATFEAVPEPATFALLGLGAVGLLRRRK